MTVGCIQRLCLQQSRRITGSFAMWTLSCGCGCISIFVSVKRLDLEGHSSHHRKYQVYHLGMSVVLGRVPLFGCEVGKLGDCGGGSEPKL